MKKTVFLVCAAALLAGHVPHAHAQSAPRYRTPGAVVLSPDLTGPWVLQLANKPRRESSGDLIHAPRLFIVPHNRTQGALTGYTPLQADPVRRNRQIAISEPISVKPPAAQVQSREQEYDPQFEMQIVDYQSEHNAGTVIIDTEARFLYLIEDGGTARRYGVGVGKPGFEWAGKHNVSRKAEWPGWSPPPEMIVREKAKGKILPAHLEGGPENPLGARAMYLGSSLYRIHGTNQPWSIGKAVSSGCIRRRNEDVIDLYERIKVGTPVIVS